MNKIFKNKTILITGGTGSFGKNFALFLKNNFLFRKIVIFSRDELKQYKFQQELKGNSKNFRFLIGDVRDKDRLLFALKDIDFVIHAAALKQVPATEYNPFECIKTNILGAQNVIESSLNTNVSKVIALSTDKAVSPLNLYGASKLCSDKLFISANQITGKKNIIFSVVRYGNVLGSRGSILPKLLDENKNSNYFSITDKNMTRFNITIDEAIKTVIWSLLNMLGGEIVVPKLSSYKILDFANAINKNKKIKYIGIRSGEKMHEEMISIHDSANVISVGKYFLILPFDRDRFLTKYKNQINKMKKQKILSYNSFDNNFVSSDKLKRIINDQINNNLVEY
jgi:UDP-N-acetylglucosamine 4,6-dehydratase (inverting)